MRTYSCCVVAVVVVAFATLEWTPSASAQAPRMRPGLGGLREKIDREKEKLAEENKFGEQAKTETADDEEAEEKTPAADAYGKGVASLDKGETDAAIAFFNRAIELNAKYAPAYCDRGLALTMKGEPEKAIADLTQAIRLAPNGGRSYFNRGLHLFSSGRVRQSAGRL